MVYTVQAPIASANIEETRLFTTEFKEITEGNAFQPDLVLNVDQAGLYWKKLQSRTYASREEKSPPGFKASKDPLTQLGGNASATLKLKSLLVYHFETPRIMKGILQSHLPVIWTLKKYRKL
jgi:hypothetical protein